MSSNAQSYSQIFKTKREEMSLSLKEVENATSIRKNYLQAIEDGKIDKFISPVYAAGFVKQYANFLGLNGEKIIQDNYKSFKQKDSNPDFPYGIGSIDIRNPQDSNIKWMPNLLWGGLAFLVLIIAWYFAKFLGVV
jgi:cytoskeletal protein RodZ